MKTKQSIRCGLLAFLLVSTNLAKADEGMWLPMLIGKNYQQMKKQGFKLSPEDLYSANKVSLKDAIVSFGGFCTGEIVSKNGLIFTNHHCGYDAVASNSTPENNILDKGFYAKSYAEEKPIPDLFVRFLVKMEDVTPQVMETLRNIPEQDKASKIAEISKKISTEATAGSGYEAEVKDLYKANQYILFVYERFNDVRLVGNPPQSIGKFGGDTDNWEWPRHTGDFSIFRVYADASNRPAAYSVDNKPYTPKKFLPVSIKGVKNNDFTIVYGFPGRTDRFLTSYGVQLATEKVNPAIIKLRDIRLKAWKEEMNKSVDTRLKLSSQYASIANYWKYFIGQTEQLKRLNIYSEKQRNEIEFSAWASNKPEYAQLMNQYAELYKKYEPYAAHYIYAGGNGLGAITWARNANAMATALDTKSSKKDDQVATNNIDKEIDSRLNVYEKTYNEFADKKIFVQLLSAFYKDVPTSQHPTFIDKIVSDYPAPTAEASFEKYANYLWEKSNLIKPSLTRNFWSQANKTALESDPAYLFAKNLASTVYIPANFGTLISDFEKKKAQLDNLYLKALLEKNKNELNYPDANSTMRITYGQIQSYSPKDAVTYQVETTIDGMMAKYQPNNDEFDLPTSLVEAHRKRNFGQYAVNGTLPVAFISNNDITGGNSGSPVINAQGELIGLAFDGNWEAMSGDIAFDKKYKRTISVDTRFVLWCIDVLGGAKNIIDELDIRM